MSRGRTRVSGHDRFPIRCHCRGSTLDRWHGGNAYRPAGISGYVQAAGNEGGKRTSANFRNPQLSIGALEQDSDTALWLLVGGYIGEGDDSQGGRHGTVSGGSAVCDEAAPLCLFGSLGRSRRAG